MKTVTLVLFGFILIGMAQSPAKESIKVMVIDTGIEPIEELKPFLATSNRGLDLKDTNGHGTHITGLILYGPSLKDPVCKEVVIYSCKFYAPEYHSIPECLRLAQELGVAIVNFSGGGRGYDAVEAKALKNYKGLFIAAAGNHEVNPFGKVTKPAWDISKEGYYPASLAYANTKVVGNGLDAAHREPSSNYGLKGMLWRNGRQVKSFSPNGGTAYLSGSSQATAIYTHEELQLRCQRLRSDK